MSRSRYLLTLLLPILLLLMAFRQSPLINPAPIAVPPNVSQEQVAKVIRTALAQRKWVVSSEKPGEIGGSLHLHERTAVIAIAYDVHSVRLRYVDSTNLRYEKKDGGEYIHKNYMDWIELLVGDISAGLTRLGS